MGTQPQHPPGAADQPLLLVERVGFRLPGAVLLLALAVGMVVLGVADHSWLPVLALLALVSTGLRVGSSLVGAVRGRPVVVIDARGVSIERSLLPWDRIAGIRVTRPRRWEQLGRLVLRPPGGRDQLPHRGAARLRPPGPVLAEWAGHPHQRPRGDHRAGPRRRGGVHRRARPVAVNGRR